MKQSIMAFMATLITLGFVWVACDNDAGLHKLNKGNVSYNFVNDSLYGGFDGPTNDDDTSSFWYSTRRWMWEASLSTNCQEIGGYVFVNQRTGEMTVGKLDFGDPGAGSIYPGSSDPRASGLGSDWSATAYVHTHPASDCMGEGEMRGVGPSDTDQDWANRTGYPVYTIDYSGSYISERDGYYIYGNGNRESAFQWYNTFPTSH